MNVQTETNKGEVNSLVYNYDEARVLVTVITTFNKCMECRVEEHRHISIDMSHYVKKIVKEFPQESLKGASVASPWNENLFKVQHDSAPLEKEQAELFHTMTTQRLFL